MRVRDRAWSGSRRDHALMAKAARGARQGPDRGAWERDDILQNWPPKLASRPVWRAIGGYRGQFGYGAGAGGFGGQFGVRSRNINIRSILLLPSHPLQILDHGDPTMYESFWAQMGEKTSVVISPGQYISYFSEKNNICWFLEPDLANSVVRLHEVVGNAVTEDRHIVIGTGSSQLFQAVLYDLSPQDALEPMSVVTAAPFYSSYPLMTDYLKSGLYKWAGNAHKFSTEKPYVELVTSPNNPHGSVRQAVVNGTKGYWFMI